MGEKLLLVVTLVELLLKTGLKFIFLIFLIILLLMQHGYYNPYHSKNKPKTPVVTKNSEPNPIAANENKLATQTPASSENAQCDGRTLCKQMISCAEATFFLNNCPNTKRMDANKNGIPCEKQWCN